ncbi:hypothetical protein WR25_03287 [Diploscapter pachys]|uniref:NAD(+) ADP-ribosyltransferase n=1 Tax=Diploscapter pachys TaxID=2018661 RepID=A0A2A2JQH5_9BILA|nr:hypothetical protein WR25_03287 [Diploscapter pachys]
MSTRVRFSEQRPNVAYLPASATSQVSFHILSKPLPPIRPENAYQMDLHTAASIGDMISLQEIVKADSTSVARRNLYGWTALLYAAYLGHEPAAAFLLDKGAKADECNDKGQTALMLAAACGNLKLRGGKVTRFPNYLKVVNLLLERGASVQRADDRDRMALHYAAVCSQNEIAELLLKAGSDPNARDSSGNTPLHDSCVAGHELTVLCLLEKGADPSMKNSSGEDAAALVSDNNKLMKLIDDYNKKNKAKNDRKGQSSGSGNGSAHSLSRLLEEMNLGRLTEKFKKENIDFNLFFELNEKDLDEMGIAYGPKKRILTVIERYKKSGMEGVTAETEGHQAGQRDQLRTSMEYVRQMNEKGKQMALDALNLLGPESTDERIRQLLISIIDCNEKITARLVRHL